jgi:hypothetical protein
MPEWLGLVMVFVVLVGVLTLIVGGARPARGGARSFRELGDYRTERQLWAVALLAGLALGELADALGGAWALSAPVAIAVGGICGWSRRVNRWNTLVPGVVGTLASVVGSIRFVTMAPSDADRLVRIVIAFALALLFGLAGLVRLQPLNGLTWFAALDLVVFLSGPMGVSWAELGGLSSAGMLAMVLVIVSGVAFAPEFVVGLLAVGVSIVQLLAPGLGYLPGNLLYSLAPVMLALGAYFVVTAVRRRVA